MTPVRKSSMASIGLRSIRHLRSSQPHHPCRKERVFLVSLMTMSTETARQPAALSPEQTKTPTPAPYAAEWRTASIWLVLAIGGLTLLYWPTIQFMERLWSFNRSYTHCFFVLPIVGYMVWMNRRRLASIRPRPSAWG